MSDERGVYFNFAHRHKGHEFPTLEADLRDRGIPLRLVTTPYPAVTLTAHLSNGGLLGQGSGCIIVGLNDNNASEQFILTAGHNLVNENGRAHRVEIIYGIDHPLQTRSGVDAVVHGSYYLEGRLINDIAIIRLNKSFIGVTPLQFRQTPITGNGAATVYGYPKDTPRFRPNGKLCVSGPSRMEYNPSLREGFIGHHSNTERGSSGGPIVDSSNTVIGVHTQGLSTINLGVPINRRGNDPKPLLRMLDYMGSHDARVPPVTIIGPVGNVGYEGVLFTWGPGTRSRDILDNNFATDAAERGAFQTDNLFPREMLPRRQHGNDTSIINDLPQGQAHPWMRFSYHALWCAVALVGVFGWFCFQTLFGRALSMILHLNVV